MGCRLLCLLLVLPGGLLVGQEFPYAYYGISEGISNRLVSDIEFGPKELVWVATGNGLNRFDGYSFLSFSSNEKIAVPYRLSQSQIKDIARSQDDRLLLFYEDLYSSFDIFDPLSFEVEKIEVALAVAGSPRNFFVDRAGTIYVVAKSEQFTTISKYDYEEKNFVEVQRFNESWHRPQVVIDFIRLAEGDFILYDLEHGLRRWSVKDQRVIYYANPAQLSAASTVTPPNLSILTQDDQLRNWISFNGQPGVYQLSLQSDSLKLFTALNPAYTYANAWQDDVGNVLFNQADNLGNFPATKHLYCLAKKNGALLDFSHMLAMGNYFLNIRSKDFFRTLFYGTDTGLKVAQNTTTKIDCYLSKRISEDKRGASMRGICEDDSGNIYFSREVNAWYRLDVTTNELDTIKLQNKAGQFLAFNNCQGIWYDPHGFIWGVTGNETDQRIGLLHRYHIADCTNTIFEYPLSMTAYADVGYGRCWLGGRTDDNRGALVQFDPISEEFSAFEDKGGNNPFADVVIRYILPVGETLWIGTEQGLFFVDLLTQTWHRYVKETPDLPAGAIAAKLSDNVVFSLYKDERNLLWIGTLNGLCSFDLVNRNWSVYEMKDGLPSSTIASILPGDNGSLWVSTYNGLSYFTPKQENSRRFFQIDGLAHNEFNRFSALRAKNGRYYFGGVNGVSAFYPGELLVSRDIPQVLLTSLTYFDRQQDSTITKAANLLDNPTFVVKTYYNHLVLNFSLPIFASSANNQFRYRIGEDPDQEWIYLKSDRSLHFSDVKAGEYRIYVQGADPNGNWGNKSLMIHLIVEEVIYLRLWFLALVFLAVIGFIYVVLRYRLDERLRMEKLRTQLASDLHDEVSGLLAGISLQSELLRSQVTDEGVGEKLQSIRQASQRAMSKMSDVIWSIDSRRDRMADLLDRMEEHADEVLLPLDIRYEIKTSHLDTEKPIPATTRQNIYFIYKEAINNVAKHAQASQVDIWVGNQGGFFELRIKDNGVGVDEAHPPTTRKVKGQGLANLRMRAQRLGAQLDILNGQGFVIHLRMKRF